jgi:uncharacterized DUF497 family protein
LTREDSHAAEASRFGALGLSDQANPLVVVYAYQEPDRIRIISGWKATKRERELHEEDGR